MAAGAVPPKQRAAKAPVPAPRRGAAREIPLPRDLRVDPARVDALAQALGAAARDVVRRVAWVLLRRAQLARQGLHGRRSLAALAGDRETVRTMAPLAEASRRYTQCAETLRDQLLCAQAHLDRALERRHSQGGDEASVSAQAAAEGAAAAAGSGPQPLTGLDASLYQAIASSVPLGWADPAAAPAAPAVPAAAPTPAQGADPLMQGLTSELGVPGEPKPAPAAGASAATSIAIDSDDEEPQGHPGTVRGATSPPKDDPQQAKRRRTDAQPAAAGGAPPAPQAPAPGETFDLGPELGTIDLSSMPDFSWLGGGGGGNEGGDASNGILGLEGLQLPSDSLLGNFDLGDSQPKP